MSAMKYADQDSKDTVFGWTRKFEKKFKLNIPWLIKYKCLDFYLYVLYEFVHCMSEGIQMVSYRCVCSMHEFLTVHGKNIAVDAFKTAAEIKGKGVFGSNAVNTVYGNIAIDSGDTSVYEYVWYFKIRNLLAHNSFVIGIDSSEKAFANSDFSSIGLNPSMLYAFGSKGRLYCHNKTNDENRSNLNGEKWRRNDLVAIALNVEQQTLELLLNNKCKEMIYGVDLQKEKKYHLAIAVHQAYAKIQLVKFEAKRAYRNTRC